MDVKAIIKRRDAAKADRQRLENLYDDCLRLTMPARRRFYTQPIDNAEDIFDETGANAVAEFVSRMQAGLLPPFTEFVKLDASAMVEPRDVAAVNKDLDDINKYLFEQIWNSNFSQEISECLYDMSISTGIMLFEEGTGDRAFHHRAVPLTDVYLELRGHTQMGFNLSTKNDNNKEVKMMPFDGLIQLTKEETDRHKEFIKKVEANRDNT